MNITDSQFVDILHDCLNSLQVGNDIKFIYDVDKWWDTEVENE
jgi:hypothetical protein